MARFRFGIRIQLYSGFGLLVAIGTGMATYGALQSHFIARQVASLGLISTQEARLAEVRVALESTAAATSKLRDGATPELVSKLNGVGQRLAAGLEEAAQHAIDPERGRSFKADAAAALEFGGTVDRLLTQAKTIADARSRLFSGGDALTAATTRLVNAVRASADVPSATADALDHAILLVRIANWRFLATQDPDGPASFTAKVADARAVLDQFEQVASMDAGLVPAVRSALGSYADDFGIISTSMLDFAKLMQAEGQPRMQALLDAFVKAQHGLHTLFAETSDGTVAAIDLSTRVQTITAATGLLLGLLIAVLIGRAIVRPLSGMTAAMQKLAAGDHALEVPARERTDALGAMARALEVFKRNAIEAKRLAETEAAGHATREARAARLDALTGSFEATVGELVESAAAAAGAMETTAQSLSATAEQTSRQSQAAAAASGQTAMSVQTVASAAEELAASVGEISRQVGQSAAIAGRAVEDARRTDEMVQRLAEGAQKIGEVVELISSIAGQTNLLALNATIEAARAGDAGKGFAVVASEVKSLANQTAHATGEIATQITAIQAATRQSVEAIQAIGRTIVEMSEIGASIATAVEQQGAATQEIARNAQQAAVGTQDVSGNVDGVQAAASQTGQAAQTVLGSAAQMVEQTRRLSGEVATFIAGVKAA
jgi:methyl-accepting chemotaxis protein